MELWWFNIYLYGVVVVFVEGVWFLLLVPTRNVTHDLARPWKRNGTITKRKRKRKAGEGEAYLPLGGFHLEVLYIFSTVPLDNREGRGEKKLCGLSL